MPSEPSAVLLIAAADAELGGHPGLACGVGPVEAAATNEAFACRRAGPAWFCDPWNLSFGLLEQEGFFRFFPRHVLRGRRLARV